MIRWPAGDIIAVCVIVGTLSTASVAAFLWAQASRSNTAIAALAAGHDVPVSHDDPAPIQAARGLYLLTTRHVEEAQALAERMSGADAASRATLLYALGNAHMRQALMIFATAPMRQVAPMIQLAKSEYRLSLRLDPDNWDARYNYDIAAALVRDADVPPSRKGEEMAHERAYFPDVPGAPNGLP
jgi:mxaK protein